MRILALQSDFGICLKILHIIPYFYPAWRFGGPVRVVFDISRKLVERGHSVTVYTSDILEPSTRVTTSYNKVEGIEIYYFKNLSLYAARRKLYFPPALITAIRENVQNFDVIHIHGNRTTLSPAIHHFLKKRSVPYVVQAHGGLPSIGKYTLNRLYDLAFGYPLLRDATRLIALTNSEAKQYEEKGIRSDKIDVIPNGVDLSLYERLPKKGFLRAKYGISDDDQIILYVGRIHEVKGIDFLIKAFERLIKSGYVNSRLVIAGSDDGYLKNLKALVSSLKIGHLVIFAGLLTEGEKLSALVDCSIVAYLSPFEPFGIVPLEAAASSKPVIVCENTAMAGIVKEGEFGFIVRFGSIVDLSKILATIHNNGMLLNRMGKKGNEYLFKNFDWSRIISRFEKTYEKAIGSQR